TQYDKDEAVGSNPRILKSGKHDRAFYQDLWDTLLRGETWTGRMTNKKKDGTLYDEEDTISPIRNEAGEIANFIALKRDITRELRLEEQLRQAQKMEAVGSLAGGIAHDFNNLLTSITGNVDLLLIDLEEHDPHRREVEVIADAAERAANLTRQLLTFSRKQVTNLNVLDLNRTIAGTRELLQRSLGELVELRTDLAADLLPIQADRTQMEQVLMNLAVNARDAMPRGGQILIHTQNHSVPEEDASEEIVPGHYVQLRVCDTGIGMTEEIRSRIFEPFFTTKEVGKGTGLGLSTVYGIVKQHRGHIQVESTQGNGTCFRILLPATQPVRSEDKAQRTHQQQLRGDELVLLVEDDPSVRASTLRALERFGYTVVETRSPVEAMDWIKQNDTLPAAVISDVVMPFMSGYELAEALQERKIEVPFLFISGYAREASRHTGILQKYPLLSKPFRPIELIRELRNLLDA
ncbi:response regulator, partial [bacterium]|nr:response regulator [bacterium]